jgi:hypothetical protein
MRRLTGIIVLAAAATAAGCLQKETIHTIYLSPDGRATWAAVERDVRSDEKDPARRLAEEQRYILAAGNGEHGVARGLAALDPTRLRTHVVRGERPFLVVTVAEFGSIEFLAQRIVMRLGLPGEVALHQDGPVATLRVRIDAARAAEREEQGEGSSQNDPLGELLEELGAYRFTLTEGRFVAANGFELRDDWTVAVPVETPWDAIVANGGILELSLSWLH